MKKGKFYNWLRENTNLMEYSIRIYCYAVQKFKSEYKELTVENMNKFIAENTREKRNYHYKYALLNYLDFMGKPELKLKLTKFKMRPRKKVGHYYSKEKILKIIEGLNFYKVVGIIQFITGARAREILSFNREKLIRGVDKILPEGSIRMILEAKGGKETSIFIPAPYSNIVLKVVDNRKVNYPFLKGNSRDFTTWLSNNYRYYSLELERSAEEQEVIFTTHDFRRNFAQMIYKASGKKVGIVKCALRHSRYTSTVRYLEELASNEEVEELIKTII